LFGSASEALLARLYATLAVFSVFSVFTQTGVAAGPQMAQWV